MFMRLYGSDDGFYANDCARKARCSSRLELDSMDLVTNLQSSRVGMVLGYCLLA